MDQHVEEAIAKLKSEFKILDSAKIELTNTIGFSGFKATIEGVFQMSFWCGVNKCLVVDLYFLNSDFPQITIRAQTLDEAIAKLIEAIDFYASRLKPWGSDRNG